jgi:T5SS/PEP-CTERM-associated repeat protein
MNRAKRPKVAKRLVAAALAPAAAWAASLPAPAAAAFNDWNTNSSGSFTIASNWTAGVPLSSDTVLFRRGVGVAYTVTFPGKQINLGGTGDYVTDRLRINSNNVTFAQSTAPNLTSSTYTVTNNAPGDLAIALGDAAGDQAVLTGNLLALNTPNLNVGHGVGATGTLNINSGSLNLAGGPAGTFLYVGYFGNGTLNVTDGGQITMGPVYNAPIGARAGSSGTARVGGAGSKWAVTNFLRVESEGTGTLIIENGGHVELTNAPLGVEIGTFASGGNPPHRSPVAVRPLSMGGALTVASRGELEVSN